MWINGFYVVQKRRATDFKALKLWKGSLGSSGPAGSLVLGRHKETILERADFTFQLLMFVTA